MQYLKIFSISAEWGTIGANDPKNDKALKVVGLRELVLFGSVLLCLLTTGCANRTKQARPRGVQCDISPLNFLVDKNPSIEEFQTTINQHPEWVNQKSRLIPDNANISPLTGVAITARTNYARVLISNNADVAEALMWCKRYNCPEGTQLILDLCKELGKSSVMASNEIQSVQGGDKTNGIPSQTPLNP